MLEIVTDICEGRGSPEQLDLLEDLAWTLSVGSLCALGKTAANPVLSTLKYFRDEYEAHIENKRCPACVCRALFRYVVSSVYDADSCVQCQECEEVCPSNAISVGERCELSINHDVCTRCGLCTEVCPIDAISRMPGNHHV
jgi:NADH-quinone oxidoreductase subunit F